ncbi:glycosyltransferase [Spiractinospora alimapuensis]|uniref:glycosyltransferase family 2 protein n=1 Tax=Spiractinospora alimapuensis TaxID=2820884 RepID=UPI001F400084|nr:glycosyltransferase [Spiractinospora alimapuensis]QVQ50446.1 glycosyltransferase [Spiractinospora alimapuensis]
MARGGVAVVVPAKDEEATVAATVEAAWTLPSVDLVLVVDDGSTDQTASRAEAAGAIVLRQSRHAGKGAAMEAGAAGVRIVEDREAKTGVGAGHRLLLFLDADLGRSAGRAADLVGPVERGEADMTIALFPPTRPRLGGHGFVVRLSRNGIRRATEWEPEQPLNGQRCLTRRAFEAARPLAPGFGVETGLTIDLLRRGFRVAEVPVPLEHRPTGTGLRSQIHRGRQFVDVSRALAARRWWRRGDVPESLPH